MRGELGSHCSRRRESGCGSPSDVIPRGGGGGRHQWLPPHISHCKSKEVSYSFRMQRKGSEPDFSVPWHMSDVVLVVEDKKFHVHKGTLSMWSPVFEKMFSASFKEKTSSEIALPGKKASEIQDMLLVIYPTAKPVTEQNYSHLLDLAQEYQMEQLTERCEKYLLNREKTPFQAIDFLVLADAFRMEELCKQCVEIAKHISMSELKKHEKYPQIEDEKGRHLAERRVELLENKAASLEQKATAIKGQVRDVVECSIKDLGKALFFKKNPEGNSRFVPRSLSDCLKYIEDAAHDGSDLNTVLQLVVRLKKVYELHRA